MDPRYASALMLMTSFAASVGGLATPVGTPPNLIGLGFIRAPAWRGGHVPPVDADRRPGRDGTVRLPGDLSQRGGTVRRARAARRWASSSSTSGSSWDPGPRGQRSVALAFSLTVSLWVLPGVAALIWGQGSSIYLALSRRMPEGVAALVGAALLFILPGRNGPAITWREASEIDWGVVLLYGGGFALGVLSFQTGLAEAVGRGLTGLLPGHGSLGLLVRIESCWRRSSPRRRATPHRPTWSSRWSSRIATAPPGVDPLEPAPGRDVRRRASALCCRSRPRATPSSTAPATSRWAA